MSLASCLRKMGSALPDSDRRQLSALVKGGMAERAALEQVLGEARAALDAVVAQIETAGGKPRRATGGALYQRAFHGSPHEFERFSLEHVGSGEGAQAYGWGLYFSSKKEVGEYYRENLAPTRFERPDGVGVPRHQVQDEVIQAMRQAQTGPMGPLQDVAIAIVDHLEKGLTPTMRKSFEQAVAVMYDRIPSVVVLAGLDVAEGYKPIKGKGKLYEVEVPENDELLEWEAPIELQPAALRDKIRRALSVPTWVGAEREHTYEEAQRIINTIPDDGAWLREDTETGQWQVMMPPSRSRMSLRNAYERARENRYEGSDKATSEALRAVGAKGHTYVGDTSGAKNYVIYDDAAIETKAMYSRAAALPGSVPNDIEALLERVMVKPIEAMTIKDRAREMWRTLTDVNVDAIRQGVIDSFDAVKQLEKGQFGKLLDAAESPYKATLATKNLPSVMAAVMLRGVPVYRDGAFQLEAGRKGVIEIFQPLTEHPDGNLLPLWELYAAAKRAKQLKAQGREKLFSDEDIRKALALGQQYPVLEQVAKDWEEFNGELLDLAVERGVLDPVAVKAWRQNFYVPFYRAMEDAAAEGPSPKRGLEGHGGQRVKKRLKGSDKPLGHVFENLLMNAAYLIDESFKNTAMQKIATMAEGVAMEKIPLNWEAVQLPAGQLERALDKMGVNVMSQRGIRPGEESQAVGPGREPDWRHGLSAEEREEWLKLFRRVAPVGKDVVRVFENGKPVYYRVTDDLLLRSIGNMGYDAFSDVFGLFRGSKRLLTSAITLDPAFMMANWVRDTISTWVTSDAGITPVISALKGAKAALSMNSEVLGMMAAGGGGGGVYDMQPAELRTFLVDKLGSANAANRFMATIVSPKNWLKVWRKIGNAAENANRVAVYRAVRAAGGSVAEAAYQARDVLNFTMSGDYAAMRWLTATVPFMNARIQGLYRLYRGAQDNPVGFALKGLALTAATLALLLRNNDDEEYERLPEWDRDMYWHLFVGGEHYRLPKPFEVGAIFGTIPERMYRLGTGRDSADIAKQRVMAMLGETFAMNPIPQIAKPMIEQYANRSFFTGSPIVGMAEANLAPEAQYTPWTSDTLRAMAEALPDFAPAWMRSPQRLEAMLRGYLGATGAYALGAADVLTRDFSGAPPRPSRKIYDAPVVRRFLQDPNPRYTKYADQLYDMLEESNEIFRTINRYREQGRIGDAQQLLAENRGKLAARTRLNTIATRIRALNNQQQLILYSQTMAPDAKRARLDELTAKKNELTALVAPMAELF